MNRISGAKLSALVVSLLSSSLAIPAHGQDKSAAGPIEIIVPWGTGGGADQLGRTSAKLLGGILNTPVTVTNVPGATGNIGMAKLLKAPSDGRSLAILTADTYALLAHLNPGWNASDVIPLAIMMKQPSALFVPADSRFSNWSDFEKEARAKPNTLRVAITGLGSPDYMTLQQLAAKNINLVPVPMANPGDRYAAIKDGRADALYEQPGDVRNMIEGKEVRALVFFSAARAPGFADVPTSSELGLGNGLMQFRAIVVKAGTSPERVKTLSDAFAKVTAMPEYKTFLKEQLAAADSYVSGPGATGFMLADLKTNKQIVEALPLHSRYIIEAKDFEEYVEPF